MTAKRAPAWLDETSVARPATSLAPSAPFVLATGGTNMADDDLGSVLEAQFRQAAAALSPCYEDAVEDHDFYDGNQWAQDQLELLREEKRPATVINQVAKAVNNMLGREASSRFSYLASPVVGLAKVAAEEITRGLAHVADAVELDVVTSDVFEFATKGPMGWYCLGYDPSRAGEEPIMVDAIHPLNMFWDTIASRKRDISDARFAGYTKVVDLDVALAAFPDVADELLARAAIASPWDSEMGAQTLISEDYGNRSGPTYAPGFEGMGWFDSKRKRLALREHWWYVEEQADVLALPDGRDLDWNPESALILKMLRVRGAQRMIKRRKCFYFAICAGDLVCHTAESPYQKAWRAYPFVPLWCFRSRKGEPYGMIANMKWPQVELNVARSRFNKSIRSGGFFYGKEGLSPAEQKQVAKAVQAGSFAIGVQNPQAVQMFDNKADSAYWLKIMETSRAEIDDVVGQNEAAYGDPSNEKSGIAIERRIQQTNQNMGRLWDNLRYARKTVGERVLGLMMAYWPMEKLQHVLATAAMDEGEEPDLTWLDEFDEDENPLHQLRFRVKLEDQAETATERQAATAHRMELLQLIQDPGLVQILLPDTLRSTDWPGSDDMAKKAEEYNQQRSQAAGAPQKPAVPYKDAPEDIRRQMEQREGFQPSQLPPGSPGNPRDAHAQFTPHPLMQQLVPQGPAAGG